MFGTVKHCGRISLQRMHGLPRIDRTHIKNKTNHIRESILYRKSDIIGGIHETAWTKSFHEYRVLEEHDGFVHYSANVFSGDRYFFEEGREK